MGRTSILFFVIQMLARAIGFLGLIYFTRTLPMESMGIYFLFYTVIQISSMVSNLGLGWSVKKRISEGRNGSGVLSAALALALLAIGVVTAVVFIFRGWLGSYIGLDVPIFIATSVGLWIPAQLMTSSLMGEERVVTAAVVQLLEDVVRVTVGGFLISIGMGAIGLMWGVLAAFATTLVVGYILLNASLTIPSFDNFRSVTSISRHTMFFGPTNFVYFWLDTAMIGLLLTRIDVAAYEVAWQSIRVVVIATMAIHNTVFPKVSRWSSNGEYDKIEKIIPKAILFAFFVPVPGAVGIAVLGEEVLSIVYQPGYSIAALAMAIMSLFMIVESLQTISSSLLTGIDRADVPFKGRVVGVVLAVLLNILLIPLYGLEGAAIATFTAKFADTAVQWYHAFNIFEFSLPVRGVIWELISAVLMGSVVHISASIVGIDGFKTLFAAVITGVAVYTLLVIVNVDIRKSLRNSLPFIP